MLDHGEVPWVIWIALGVALSVKLAGYLVAAKVLARAFPRSRSGALAPALARTLLGVGAGWLYCRLWSWGGPPIEGLGGALLLFYAGLFASRVAQWWIVLALFFDEALESPPKGWTCAVAGALWSHFLDLPAFVAFLIALGKLLPTLLDPFAF